MSIFVDVNSLSKSTTFKLSMTRKQKFELELIHNALKGYALQAGYLPAT